MGGCKRIEWWRWLLGMASWMLASAAMAQYVAPYVGLVGKISSPNGMAAQNYSIWFTPSQEMFVGGTSVVVGTSNCATDTNGSVVGIRNPLTPAIVAALYTGTLPTGNYQVQITWYDSYGNQTLPSPVTQMQLMSAGALQVTPPTSGAPANAIGMNVYIGMVGEALTYQGQTSSTTATYTQSSVLTSGAALPTLNTTLCQVVANDAAWPIGGYEMGMANATAKTMPGFPQQVQFFSPGSTYNVSNGLPLYNGRAIYPIPILSTPYNHNPQSISGPLSLTNYPLTSVSQVGVGTALPGWGVDVEGKGVNGQVNAAAGYLVAGNGGTEGECLASDGTAYDTQVPCVTSLPTIYYQTIYAGTETILPQRPILNFMSPQFAVSDQTSPAMTLVSLQATAPASQYVVTSSAAGTSGHCMQWGAAGDAEDAGASCSSVTTQSAGLISSDGTSGSRQFYQVADPEASPPTGAYVYQNTTGKRLLVTVSADGGGGGFHGVVYCDTNASPTTVVARFARVNAGSTNPNYYPGSVTFVVPVGYYYGISTTSGGGNPVGSNGRDAWTEWQF